MLTVLLAGAMIQTAAAPIDHQAGPASAEIALAFIRERDPATANRLRGELAPWLTSHGPRIGTLDAQTVRAAGEELNAMFVGHRAMWGDTPQFARAAAAAEDAWRALQQDLAAIR